MAKQGRNRNCRAMDGGEVAIFAKNRVPRPGESTGVVEIIVADSGSCMAVEALRQAFDSTTKPVGLSDLRE
ncbi:MULTISPECIES: hypothetical protein [unclassified Bradyrhizobium]|uniref:hypothetical protein n=1 Tax=unclassified Bradyrhizobium TaxID=2631580 RepID=UPI0024788215|nr:MULTISPECIES: hypothetical protein [unclassified Bradyrhizobium]WGS19942.1 hypothetical protein MTX22_37455 [Bradyrhizobium sp. ISRA463]WGS26796.1 hypothetical protein MTX19_34905 [Bradyrhizobium sp. ISRA464]